MATKNNKVLEILTQISEQRKREAELIERLKEDADADLLDDLTRIEQSGWNAIIEIDDLRKKINPDRVDRREMKKVLHIASGAAYIARRLGSVRY